MISLDSKNIPQDKKEREEKHEGPAERPERSCPERPERSCPERPSQNNFWRVQTYTYSTEEPKQGIIQLGSSLLSFYGPVDLNCIPSIGRLDFTCEIHKKPDMWGNCSACSIKLAWQAVRLYTIECMICKNMTIHDGMDNQQIDLPSNCVFCDLIPGHSNFHLPRAISGPAVEMWNSMKSSIEWLH
jgi:hypothetical protein